MILELQGSTATIPLSFAKQYSEHYCFPILKGNVGGTSHLLWLRVTDADAAQVPGLRPLHFKALSNTVRPITIKRWEKPV